MTAEPFYSQPAPLCRLERPLQAARKARYSDGHRATPKERYRAKCSKGRTNL